MGGIYARRVTSETELEEVYRLRYKVYVEEWGFEKAEDHPSGLERDIYDPHALHFVEFDGADRIIGTARIILNSDKGFPIESHCAINADLSNIDRSRLGEISRLAISKEYRRRVEDRLIYDGKAEMNVEEQRVPEEKRKRQEIVLNLYKCVYTESKKLGLTHWYAVMARGLYLLLRRTGIVLRPIGPEVYYHGFRSPYLGSINEIEAEVMRTNLDLLREFNEASAQT